MSLNSLMLESSQREIENLVDLGDRGIDLLITKMDGLVHRRDFLMESPLGFPATGLTGNG